MGFGTNHFFIEVLSKFIVEKIKKDSKDSSNETNEAERNVKLVNNSDENKNVKKNKPDIEGDKSLSDTDPVIS